MDMYVESPSVLITGLSESKEYGPHGEKLKPGLKI